MSNYTMYTGYSRTGGILSTWWRRINPENKYLLYSAESDWNTSEYIQYRCPQFAVFGILAFFLSGDEGTPRITGLVGLQNRTPNSQWISRLQNKPSTMFSITHAVKRRKNAWHVKRCSACFTDMRGSEAKYIRLASNLSGNWNQGTSSYSNEFCKLNFQLWVSGAFHSTH